MSEIAQRITENLVGVRERIAAAAQRAGRHGDEITLIAVTKYVGEAETRALVDAGCHDIGESRPQELWRKQELLADRPIRWHLIGHLQRNKLRRTLPLVSLMHSGDSQRLLEAVSHFAVETEAKIPVLLELNISGDETKHGLQPDELEIVLPSLAKLPGLEIRGLMAMASRQGGAAQARHDFARLRELRDQLAPSAPSEVKLQELSMGMSGDFEVAIEEGATMVRVGSVLFEGILPPR